MEEILFLNFMCGGSGKKATPVPISNTAVKLLSADGIIGIVYERVGHCRAYIGDLAQLGEHLPYKEGVGGSSPSISITYRDISSVGRATGF